MSQSRLVAKKRNFSGKTRATDRHSPSLRVIENQNETQELGMDKNRAKVIENNEEFDQLMSDIKQQTVYSTLRPILIAGTKNKVARLLAVSIVSLSVGYSLYPGSDKLPSIAEPQPIAIVENPTPKKLNALVDKDLSDDESTFNEKLIQMKLLTDQLSGIADKAEREMSNTKKNMTNELLLQKNEYLGQIAGLKSELNNKQIEVESIRNLNESGNREIIGLKQRIETQKTELREKQKAFDEAQLKLSEFNDQTTKANNQRQSLVSEIESLNLEIDELRDQNGKLNIKMSQLRKEARAPIAMATTEEVSTVETVPYSKPKIMEQPVQVETKKGKKSQRLQLESPKSESHAEANKLDKITLIGISSDSVVMTYEGKPVTIKVGGSANGIKIKSIDLANGIVHTSEGSLRVN